MHCRHLLPDRPGVQWGELAICRSIDAHHSRCMAPTHPGAVQLPPLLYCIPTIYALLHFAQYCMPQVCCAAGQMCSAGKCAASTRQCGPTVGPLVNQLTRFETVCMTS